MIGILLAPGDYPRPLELPPAALLEVPPLLRSRSVQLAPVGKVGLALIGEARASDDVNDVASRLLGREVSSRVIVLDPDGQPWDCIPNSVLDALAAAGAFAAHTEISL